MIEWPDLKFPPINLWVVPELNRTPSRPVEKRDRTRRSPRSLPHQQIKALLRPR